MLLEPEHLQSIFFCITQKKEIHTGLERQKFRIGEFLFLGELFLS